MRKNGDGSQKQISGGGVAGGFSGSGFGGGLGSRSARSSLRALSNCLRVISSSASTVARSAVAAASAAVDKDNDSGHDQVIWAGFDKLEEEDGNTRRVLLLGFHNGFQIWDVEEADNVHVLVSKHDSYVSALQMLANPNRTDDKFLESRPLLAVCANENGGDRTASDPGSETLPTAVHIYSLKSQSSINMLKFRSIVYTVRSSFRIVAVLQAAQIHCFDAATLERGYTILTNPIASGSGVVGYGPIALGPRWLAYSGTHVDDSSSGHVSPQRLTASATFSGHVSNGSLVAHYAKESSKQLASGIVTLGDKGYKKLSRYCSEILPESYNSSPYLVKANGTHNNDLTDAESVGMVIVRDIVRKNILSQFRAHKSPISALCFDPSGILLVTASVQGHNINVFRIMPKISSTASTDATPSYVHLYRLQRGFTNAVIQDISFSNDSSLIMISSSRGTSHLFEMNPEGEIFTEPPRSGPRDSSPVSLSAVSRIRNGRSGWMGSVSGAAAAATGRTNSLPGAIASTFCYCNGRNDRYHADNTSAAMKSHLLVFSPSGCMTQYALRTTIDHDETTMNGLTADFESVLESEGKLAVEPIQRWAICQKHSRREPRDHTDIYGGGLDSKRIFPENASVHEDAKRVAEKGNDHPKDNHQLYISEMELQTHPRHPRLWEKSKFSFRSMVPEGLDLDEENNKRSGEIDIERIPTCVIEARSKHLVPVFNHLHPMKFQQPRVSAMEGNKTAEIQNLSENNLCSPDDLDEGGSELTCSPSDPESARQTDGYVNSEKGLAMEPRSELGFVNSNAENVSESPWL